MLFGLTLWSRAVRRAALVVCGPQAVKSLLGDFGLLAVGRHVEHPLPRLLGAFQILLAEGANDSDVQERF